MSLVRGMGSKSLNAVLRTLSPSLAEGMRGLAKITPPHPKAKNAKQGAKPQPRAQCRFLNVDSSPFELNNLSESTLLRFPQDHAPVPRQFLECV